MRSFKRWMFGAIVLVALALVACSGMVPTPTGKIADMTFEHDDMEARTEPLGNYFLEDDGATYKAVSDKEAVATASTSGSTLTVTPKGAGTATVTVTATASNGRDTAEQMFKVTVKAAPPPTNTPPVARTIPDVTVQAGMTKTLELKRYFVDAELDPLTFTATVNPSDGSIAMVSPVDAATSAIIITAVAEGTATITVTASDGKAPILPVSIQTFDVIVTAMPVEPPPDNNQPRQTREIPDLSGLVVGGSPTTVDLSMYFTDDEGDDVRYNADSSNPNVVTTSVSGSVVTITVVMPGTARIDVTATDEYNQSVTASFTVEVINQPPMETDGVIVDLILRLPGGETEFDLTDYFTDAEGDALTYSASVAPAEVATASVAGSMITITAMVAGDATITVTADDGTNQTSRDLTLTVTDVPNEEPEVVGDGIPDQSLEMDFDDATKDLPDLSMYFTDPDGEDANLTFTADSSMTNYATAEVNGSTLTLTAVMAGETMVTVTASDGEDMVSDMFTVTVSNPPKPTRGSLQPSPVTFEHGETDPKMVSLGDYFENAKTYGASVAPEGVVTATESGGTLTLTPVGPGMATVTVTPSNSAGSGESWNIDVTVESAPTTPPMPPRSTDTLQARTITSDAAPVTIDLSMYFERATSYDVASDNEAVLTATESGGTLTLTPHKHGEAEVTVNAINDDGEVEQDFVVTVQAKPTFKMSKSLPDLRIHLDADALDTPVEMALDLSTLFEDPDGVELTYSTKTSDAKKVYVIKDGADPTTHDDGAERDKALMAAGDMVTLVGRAAGTATITVTVTDSDDLSIMEPFMVMVVGAVNNAPTAVNESATGTDDGAITSFIDESRLKLSDDPKKAIEDKAINDYFGDADLGGSPGDELKFTVEYSTGTEPAPAQVGGSGPVKVTVPDGEKVADADRVAIAMVSPDMWDGDPHGGEDKFTVTVTPTEKAGGPQRILIIATDLSGAQAVRSFQVDVNNPPKPEGAQDTPLKLSSFKLAEGLKSTQPDGTTVNTVDVPIVEPDGGYFSDSDMAATSDASDTLTCSFRPSVTGDTAPATLAWDIGTGNDAANNTESVTLIVTTKAVYRADFVSMKVAVSCSDGLEETTEQTFVVSVGAQASIQ